VIGVFVQRALQPVGVPVSTSFVQLFPSPQLVGHPPSQVSPPSMTPFPQTGEQSESLLALQPGAQQPSPPVHIVIAVTLLTGLQESVGGGMPFLAHLGGLGAVWIFSRAENVRLVERIREGVSALPDDPPEDQPPRAVPRTLPRARAQRETIDEVVARTNAETARERAPARRRPEPEQAGPAADADPSIDAILDKISAEGMDHLTPDERRVLDDHSRRLRDR
jgi:hypothetical protein